MALANYSFTAIIDADSDGGNTIANQSVLVKIKSSDLNASLFSDEAGLIPISNPSTTGLDGVLNFWVESDVYIIQSGTRTEVVPIGTFLTTAEKAKIGAVVYGFAGSDETTDLAVDLVVPVFTDYLPYNFTLSEVMINVNTAPTGSVLTFDLKLNGTTVFSTLPTIDISENTTITAATPQVIDTSALSKGDKIEFFVTTIGSTIAGAGVKIKLIGILS